MVATVTTPRLMAVGGGALAELPGLLERLGLASPLIVTDPFLAGSGHLDRATAYLDRAGIPWTVFSDTVADPTTAVVEAGARRLAEGSFDSLVAIGGAARSTPPRPLVCSSPMVDRCATTRFRPRSRRPDRRSSRSRRPPAPARR